MRANPLRRIVSTNGFGRDDKRPVLGCIHGGGFGQRLWHDRSLTARTSPVSATRLGHLNHRLNAFGFLHLAESAGRIRAGANAGMLDLIAALQWVRDNIANFGGDPNNVMVFGQSGGGGR